jgi:hypothetical protein
MPNEYSKHNGYYKAAAYYKDDGYYKMSMKSLFRALSATLFISALVAVATLLIFDVLNQLRPTSVHQQTGALAFILIGSSFIGLQLSSGRRWNEVLKEILLGTAFVLWGSEQFLPASPFVTALDSLVVLIFVCDLSSIITARLKRKDQSPL